jgi:hypothetical protein
VQEWRACSYILIKKKNGGPVPLERNWAELGERSTVNVLVSPKRGPFIFLVTVQSKVAGAITFPVATAAETTDGPEMLTLKNRKVIIRSGQNNQIVRLESS